MIGPFVGLLLIQYSSFNVLFIVMSICIVAGGILAATVNTDDLPKPAHQGKLTFKLNDLFERKALPTAAIASLVAFSYASVLSFLSVYAQQKRTYGHRQFILCSFCSSHANYKTLYW
ncbi:hypothetical protein ABFY60_00460 [Lysinibacillus pakistanensis]